MQRGARPRHRDHRDRSVVGLLLFLFGVLEMPHRWSAEKLVARRDRTLRLGFLQPRIGDGKMVLVDKNVAERVKYMAKGIAATRAAELGLGCHRRHASQLAAVIGEKSGSAAAESFAEVVRRANNAEHASFLSAAARREKSTLPVAKLPGALRPSWAHLLRSKR
jgi:hypothetical protein